MKAEKESSPKAAENKTSKKQSEALPLYQTETKNPYSQNQGLNNSHGVIHAVHSPNTAYTQGAELMYRKLLESFEKTGDLDHPDTKQKEKDYIGTLSFLEARNYNDITSTNARTKSISPNIESPQVQLKPEGKKQDVPETISFNQSTEDEILLKRVTVKKGQVFNDKLIETFEELCRFAESQMGITRPTKWVPELTTEQVKEYVTKGAILQFRINLSHIRSEIEQLSEDKKSFINDLPGNEIQNLRIIDLLNQLTPEEIADYRNKVSTQSSNLLSAEISLRAYIESRKQKRKEQDKFESIKTKLFGLEDIYKRYVEFSKSSPTTTFTSTGNIPITIVNEEYEPEKKQLTEDLITSGFKGGIPEFETFIKNYQTGFENKTAQLGIDYLQGYKHFLYIEQNKLSDNAYLESLLARLKSSGAKQKFDKANEAERIASNSRWGGKPYTSEQTTFIREAQEISYQESRIAKNNIRDFRTLTPLANDDAFDSEGFAQCTTTAQIKTFLQSYITQRNITANNAIAKIQKNPEHIYELDELFVIAKKQEQVKEDSIYDSILKAKYKEIHQFDVLKAIGLGILSVAIIIATWGAATPVVIGGTILSAGISIGLAYEAIEEYKTKQDFHDVGLLSDDPSIAWVVLAIAGVALDAAALAKVLQSAQPIATAAKAFNDAKDTAEALSKLEKDLLKIEGLNDRLQQNIVKQAKIKAQEQKLLEGFAQARKLTYVAIPGMVQSGELLGKAIFAIKKGIVTFDSFLTELKLANLISEIGLNPHELVLVKDAYDKARTIVNDETLASRFEIIIKEGDNAKLKELSDYINDFYNLNWKWESRKTFGHAFLEHGHKNSIQSLIDRGRKYNTPQGYWTDNGKAAEIIKKNWHTFKDGENTIDIPLGLGKQIYTDGTIIENVTKAIVVKNPKGATNRLTTAYPKIIK